MAFIHSPKIVTSGLVFAVDAANVKSYVSGSTTWSDLSGNRNNGTLTNGPTFSTGSGGSIVFDGVNDYVMNNAFVNPPTSTFTIGCWARFSSVATGRYLLSFGKDAFGLALFAYGFGGGQLIFEMGSGVGNVSSGIIPTIGVWYNIVATGDGTNTRFYLNGNLTGTASQGGKQIAGTPTLSLGSYVDAGGNPSTYYHHGNIALAQIYNRALSAQEILQNFNTMRSRFGV